MSVEVLELISDQNKPSLFPVLCILGMIVNRGGSETVA